MGIANVVARSVFVNSIDQDLCLACEICVEYCEFGALEMVDGYMQVKEISCVGCGVCVPACPEGALSLVRRPEEEIMEIPSTEEEWLEERAEARGIDIRRVL